MHLGLLTRALALGGSLGIVGHSVRGERPRMISVVPFPCPGILSPDIGGGCSNEHPLQVHVRGEGSNLPT